MCKHTDKVIIGVDIGGSHISSALVNAAGGSIIEATLYKQKIEAKAKSPAEILEQWVKTIRHTASKLNGAELKGIGIAMPGPFDYNNGVSLLNGVDKYESLYGVNIKSAIASQLQLSHHIPVLFENDAACFGLGEGITGEAAFYKNIIAITLGTGFGASFIRQKKIMQEGNGIPDHGYLYNVPFKEGIAEDYISSRWLLKEYFELSGKEITEVKEIATLATVENDKWATEVFRLYGNNLAACLAHWLRSFKADCLVVGGSISNASHLFLNELTKALSENEGINVPIKISKRMELSAISGAAGLIREAEQTRENKARQIIKWRKSSQKILPPQVDSTTHKPAGYNIYPFSGLGYRQDIFRLSITGGMDRPAKVGGYRWLCRRRLFRNQGKTFRGLCKKKSEGIVV